MSAGNFLESLLDKNQEDRDLALNLAIRHDIFPWVEKLVSSWWPTLSTERGVSLAMASQFQSTQLLDRLLQAVPTSYRPKELSSALACAAQQGYEQAVKILLGRGAEPLKNQLLLPNAVRSGSLFIVAQLTPMCPAPSRVHALIASLKMGRHDLSREIISQMGMGAFRKEVLSARPSRWDLLDQALQLVPSSAITEKWMKKDGHRLPLTQALHTAQNRARAAEQGNSLASSLPIRSRRPRA